MARLLSTKHFPTRTRTSLGLLPVSGCIWTSDDQTDGHQNVSVLRKRLVLSAQSGACMCIVIRQTSGMQQSFITIMYEGSLKLHVVRGNKSHGMGTQHFELNSSFGTHLKTEMLKLVPMLCDLLPLTTS